MCTAFIAWKPQASTPLTVLSNRDEFHARPTAAADWSDNGSVLGGLDLQAGGRWLGLNRRGAFAVLLNVRDLAAIRPDAKSRGALVDDFLCGDLSAYDYAASLGQTAKLYNPYNLILCDGQELVFYSNHPASQPQRLDAGLYGISNGGLDELWPKVEQGKRALPALLDCWSIDKAFDFLANKQQAEEASLPKTGVPQEFERLLSSLFISSEAYGTRASTVVTVASNQTEFHERSFDSSGQQIDEKHYRF